MHIYWRIQNELSTMGEFLIFLDPSLNRSFRDWIKRNLSGLSWTEDWDQAIKGKHTLN
jgi:hypothetical protein